jgi:diadenosine tetraphosphate (Ap4A) HIT family hydrolase
MSGEHNPTLWENDEFILRTPKNPHVPYSEGLHLVLSPKRETANAWEDPDLAAATFKIAAKVCKLIESTNITPWFNIQANGNWGLLPGTKPFFHLHIYGRNKTERWGKPIVLPEAPGTYQNDVMPEKDLVLLETLFSKL